MRLKKLELYGFKSFAQRTEIVFNEGITGIVGPNGSGKSNIGDAVRWVLGEQSAKTLRGASMADVIFNGTQKRKPLSYCEVSLVFENEDRALLMDYAEVMVTRRVYRNGESEYYLNRASCRLRDVIDLFRDTGIGKEGYSIIGQGRIDEILSRRGEDRRQVFEEAAGIVKFKARKEEAEKKLQHTLENASRIQDILDELGRRLGPLEEQSRAARAYQEMFAELKVLDMNLFLYRSDRYTERLAELDGELMNLHEVLDQAEMVLAEKAAKRDALQAAIADLEEKLSGARDSLMALTEQMHEAENHLAVINSRRDTRAETRERTAQEIEEGAQRISELETLFVQSADEARIQETLVEKAERLLDDAKMNADQASEAEQAAEEALESHKEAILRSMNRFSAVHDDMTRLTTMRAQMEQRHQEIVQDGEKLREEEPTYEANAENAHQQRIREEETADELRAAHAQAQQTLNEASAAIAEVRADYEKQTADMQSAQSRYKLLSEMSADMEGYNFAVKRAMQHASQSGMRGVRGVLAQLVSVPQRYEVAIDMALGASQQNIVTDNEETAKQLIDYLRKNRCGRATFLPMTTVRSKTLNDRERNVLTMPGCVGVASDLISCAPEFKGVIENLLGRTVIAENLDCGIKIMRAGGHAFRLVTLEGDVMHSGGSMTGGSIKAQVTNLFGREREMKELEQTLRDGKGKLEKLRSDYTAAQQKRDAARTAVQDALEELHQQEIAVAREHEHEERARHALEAFRARIEATDEAAAQLLEAMADIDQQLSDIEQTSGSEETDRAEMEERRVALQQALAEARKASAEAQEHVVVRTLQLNDLQHEQTRMNRDRDRFQQDKEQAAIDQERRITLLAEMDEQEAQDAQDAQRLTGIVQMRSLELSRQEAVISSLDSRRMAEQKQLNDILTDMENLHQAVSRDQDRQHRTELTRSRVDNDLRSLQDRIWNKYEMTYAGAEEYRWTEEFSVTETDRRAAQLATQIRALGVVNVKAVEEYDEAKERFDVLTRDQNDLKAAEADLRALIERLVKQMEVTFVENFTKLQGYFSETFTRLFGGGHAELKLMDPADPLNCGIEVNAQPPGKKLQLLSLLSGGERALTAIAILFAMLKLKPTPFCILDEIEAALDDANIGYFADYLAEYSKGTQFVVVTHRKGTMERCNSLYGVAMEEQGVSRMVSVSLQDYEE